MVRQSGKSDDDDDHPPRYHGKRRNATTNISRQYNSENPSTSNRIGRVSQNPIYSRISTNVRQPHKKSDHKWRSGQHVNRRSKEGYATMEAVGRLKIGPKSYKIGDSNDKEVKPILASQPFCKLGSMSQEVFDLIVNFMQQYFTCFDKNRDELLAAYHSKALFSISFNLKSASTNRRATRYGSYVRDSRNLLYVQNEERAYNMLHRNNIDIVAWLKKLPITDHVSSSFKLDVTYFQAHMLTFTISGVYKEKNKPEETFSCLRAFYRAFVCVPVSSDKMIIVNEQCSMSNLTEQQMRTYGSEIQKPKTVTMREEEEGTRRAIPSLMQNTSEDPKQVLIQRFSNATNLTLNWAKDCLEFSDWNYDAAVKNFNEHKADIPGDAFIQNHLMN